jgi:hypothetical protein
MVIASDEHGAVNRRWSSSKDASVPRAESAISHHRAGSIVDSQGKPPLRSFQRISAQMGWEGLTVQEKLSGEVD